MTCGYICPQCEGKGLLDSGENCDYCNDIPKEISKEEWLKSVHEGSCCSDVDSNQMEKEI